VYLKVVKMSNIYSAAREDSMYHIRSLFGSMSSRKYRAIKKESIEYNSFKDHCYVAVRYENVEVKLEVQYKKVDYYYDYDCLSEDILRRMDKISKIFSVYGSRPLYDINPHWVGIQKEIEKSRNLIKHSRNKSTRVVRYWCKSRHLPPLYYYDKNLKVVYKMPEDFFKRWFIKSFVPEYYNEIRSDRSVDTFEMQYSGNLSKPVKSGKYNIYQSTGDYTIRLDVPLICKKIKSAFTTGKVFSERSHYKLTIEGKDHLQEILKVASSFDILNSKNANSFYSFFKMFDRGIFPKAYNSKERIEYYMKKKNESEMKMESQMEEKNIQADSGLIDDDLSKMIEYYFFKEHCEKVVDEMLLVNQRLREIEKEYEEKMLRVEMEYKRDIAEQLKPRVKIKSESFILNEPKVKKLIRASHEEIESVRIPWRTLRAERFNREINSRMILRHKPRVRNPKPFRNLSVGARNFLYDARNRSSTVYIIDEETQTWVYWYFNGEVNISELMLALYLKSDANSRLILKE
jgi:hypothetical protein